jgi:succinyl-diaminopimelate desuccinylase
MVKKEIECHQIPCFIGDHNGFPFLIAGDNVLADVLFLCHIDIVPGKIEQFKLKINQNKIFGRGVLDMKGPLVASLDSFLNLWKIGRKQFLFAITSDEEIGGFNGSNLLTKTWFKNIKNAVIPDSTGDDLVLIQKAPFHIKVNSVGISCHGSKPWEGINAADKLLRCCNEIVEKINKNSPEFTSACISQFHSGDATNKVPDSAMATLDIRIREELEVPELIESIDHGVNKWACSWEKIDEPLFFETKANNLFIKKWIAAFEKVIGKKPNTKVECGASDARFLWHDLKIPVIIASAIGGGAHSDKEWVNLDSLNLLSATIFEFGLLVTKINSL